MAINWSNICSEIAKANGYERFAIIYRKNGEIKRGVATKEQIEIFPKFGIEVISIEK